MALDRIVLLSEGRPLLIEDPVMAIDEVTLLSEWRNKHLSSS
jgi:hypothetical protein